MSGIRIDSREWDSMIGAFAAYRDETIVSAAMAATLSISGHAIRTKLTAANPPFLNRDTGHLVRTVAASPRATLAEDRAIGTFGSHLDYAAKHEFGGTYVEEVRAHARRQRSRDVFEGTVAQGVAFVRAHTRRRTYRARRMIATALEEKSHVPAEAAAAAIRLLLANNRPPTVAQVLAQIGGR